MKKNILGAFVIVFIAGALFLMIDDITSSSKQESSTNIEAYSAEIPEMVTVEQDD